MGKNTGRVRFNEKDNDQKKFSKHLTDSMTNSC